MPRRSARNWTQTEITTLLSLVEGSGKAARLLSSKRCEEAIWQKISQGLAAAGYQRSVSQCYAKWKLLKLSFLWMRENRRRADYHMLQLMPYYGIMDIIWKAAGRPIFDRILSLKVHTKKHRLAFSALNGLVSRLSSVSSPSGSRGTEAMGEQPEEGEASDTDLCESDVRGTPEDVQPLLLQILQASQQQQALLENLAKETASQLKLISQNLSQVGETLQKFLLWQELADLNPTQQRIPRVLIFVDGSAVTCSSCASHTFSDGNGKPQPRS